MAESVYKPLITLPADRELFCRRNETLAQQRHRFRQLSRPGAVERGETARRVRVPQHLQKECDEA